MRDGAGSMVQCAKRKRQRLALCLLTLAGSASSVPFISKALQPTQRRMAQARHPMIRTFLRTHLPHILFATVLWAGIIAAAIYRLDH